MNTLPDHALNVVLQAIELAPPSPTVLTIVPSASLHTILRQCGAVAGIASERSRGNHYPATWAGIEATVLLACFAIEKEMDGCSDCALRMLKMAHQRLDVLRVADLFERSAA
jgi:hypothetical protein